MNYNAIDVAKWLLTEEKRQRIPMTHMKLQKLLYYAQAYIIGMTGEQLFNNKIEAWTHGPVVPDVYSKYKKYGNDVINDVDNVKIPDELSSLISMIIQDKGNLSAHELREATHNETPWQEACNTPDKIITNDMIAVYFSSQFWTSDEEDYYQPYFDSIDEEEKYIHSKIMEEADDEDKFWMSVGKPVSIEKLKDVITEI